MNVGLRKGLEVLMKLNTYPESTQSNKQVHMQTLPG